MSLIVRDGEPTLDVEALWERKRKMIENLRGLSVWRGGDTFAQIGGVESIKSFLREVIEGEEPPRVLVLLDEFEKAMAGAEGSDTSGTAQEMHGSLLSEMEDQGYTGLIFVGVAGSCKSYLAKCAGATFSRPVIQMQIAQMKEKYVGSSNENLTQALAAIRAISQGRARHARERLEPGEDGKPKVFRNTLVENLNGFLETFNVRNIADDQELARMVDEMRRLAQGVTSQDLRSREALRGAWTAEVARIETQLTQMVADRPGRRITLD